MRFSAAFLRYLAHVEREYVFQQRLELSLETVILERVGVAVFGETKHLREAFRELENAGNDLAKAM